MGRIACTTVALVLIGAACGSSSSALDAGPQDATDMRPLDVVCGDANTITGELVDIDSSTSAFAGVSGATFTPLAGGPPATTAPNGRFELCSGGTSPFQFAVDAPADRLDGTAYIDTRTPGGRMPSLRSFTAARVKTFYQEHGLVFDGKKAHVLVFVAGDRSDVTLDRQHDTALAADDPDNAALAWSAGVVGRYVLFPNVDVGQSRAMLGGDPAGPHTIPIAAGSLTLVSIAWFFL